MTILAGLMVSGTLGTLRASSTSLCPDAIAPAAWEAAASGPVDVLVLLDEQADLSSAEKLPTREERLHAVYDTLRTTALRSQADLRAVLDASGVSYRSFYVANMIALRGDREFLQRLATRRDVGRVVANPSVRQALPGPKPEGVHSQATEGIEWNVERVNADDVWGMGYTGQNIVVAGQDTGYDWDHPALIGQYRGYNGVTATHDYNWHDAVHVEDPSTPEGNPCGFDATEPCDDDGHGTHTMGTMVGDDGGGNQIGVAPGAEWIGCRNMEEGWGTPATYAECFEFFLAPYPMGGDPLTDGQPSLAPHVINNSWTCPPWEGCDPDTLKRVVENVRAAGIVVVSAAGNTGSAYPVGCESVARPPAIYDASISVGATDSADVIADFSSRGPVTVDLSGRRKPDIVAPGVDIRSSVPGGWYAGDWRGTSMAAPHVAGTVALLWSAAPGLIGQVDATERIMGLSARSRTTTQGCGGDGSEDVPNNVYGWGIVDALSAVDHAWLQTSQEAAVEGGLAPRKVRYSLAVTNSASFTLTNVTLTDTIPLSTTLAWADEPYQRVDGTVVWSVPTMAPGAVLLRRLEVNLDAAAPGATVVNDQYGARANELFGSVGGMPSVVLIPWRTLLFPVFRGWQPGEVP